MNDPVRYLSVGAVLRIHRTVIEHFGGEDGLRDRGLLEAAVAMPRATFAGLDLHEDLAQKAAAYHFHLCANHPFVDGNKRVAVVSAELFLEINGGVLTATDAELEALTVGVAEGRKDKTHVTAFFQKHVSADGRTDSSN